METQSTIQINTTTNTANTTNITNLLIKTTDIFKEFHTNLIQY